MPTAKTKLCTLPDVARVAQVSRSSAFAALNKAHSTNIGVSEERRQQVLRVARELGYVRNDLARSLVSGKSKMIGVLVPTLTTQFFNDFFTSLDDACYAQGYTVFVTSSEFNKEREARNLRAFLNRRMDGVVVGCSRLEDHAEVLEQMSSQGMAVLMLGTVETPGVNYLAAGFDQLAIARLTASQLRVRGHRRVLYFAADLATDNSQRTFAIHRDNFSHVWHQADGDLIQVSTTDPRHGGSEAVHWLTTHPRADWPTALVCDTSVLAMNVISALNIHRIAVPAELAVVGCDDTPLAALAPVPLTTVRLPTDELAKAAWGLLAGEIQGTLPPTAPRRLLIQPQWVERQSCPSIVSHSAEA